MAGARQALVAERVGERQQRLLRELEKLALSLGPGGAFAGEQLEWRAGRQLRGAQDVVELADALVAGDEWAAKRRGLPRAARAGRAANRPALPDGPPPCARRSTSPRRLEAGESAA